MGLIDRNIPLDNINKTSDIKETLREIVENAQSKNFDILTETPTVNNIGESEIKIDTSTSTKRLVLNLNGTLYKLDLTEL